MGQIEFEKFEGLLSEYEKLDPIPRPVPTIFEISGYPHFEDVISNVLQFFFAGDEGHGFSSVFVRSLLAAANKLNDGLESADFSVVNVQREEPTGSGNRIDLVIETDTVCIAIENKIYAGLYNDLSDYETHINSKYPGSENIFLVLSLRDIERPQDWDGHNFTLVTYAQFIEKLEEELGKAVLETDTKFIVYLSDLIKTLRDMNKRTELTPEFLQFLDENRSDIESLYENAFKKFKSEIRSKADQIDSLITVEDTEFRSFHFNDTSKLKYVQIYEKPVAWDGHEFKLKIKLRFLPMQYTLEVWCENSSDRKAFKGFIEGKFEKEFSEWDHHRDSEMGSIEYLCFEYGEDPEVVAEKVKNLMEKL